ncbi:MAG: hypothetical protein K6G28_00030 [Acholeplasmatales bacterium]|nr:hypothetical protein [Acholeplasmatales bacterium]
MEDIKICVDAMNGLLSYDDLYELSGKALPRVQINYDSILNMINKAYNEEIDLFYFKIYISFMCKLSKKYDKRLHDFLEEATFADVFLKLDYKAMKSFINDLKNAKQLGLRKYIKILNQTYDKVAILTLFDYKGEEEAFYANSIYKIILVDNKNKKYNIIYKYSQDIDYDSDYVIAYFDDEPIEDFDPYEEESDEYRIAVTINNQINEILDYYDLDYSLKI